MTLPCVKRLTATGRRSCWRACPRSSAGSTAAGRRPADPSDHRCTGRRVRRDIRGRHHHAWPAAGRRAPRRPGAHAGRADPVPHLCRAEPGRPQQPLARTPVPQRTSARPGLRLSRVWTFQYRRRRHRPQAVGRRVDAAARLRRQPRRHSDRGGGRQPCPGVVGRSHAGVRALVIALLVLFTVLVGQLLMARRASIIRLYEGYWPVIRWANARCSRAPATRLQETSSAPLSAQVSAKSHSLVTWTRARETLVLLTGAVPRHTPLTVVRVWTTGQPASGGAALARVA